MNTKNNIDANERETNIVVLYDDTGEGMPFELLAEIMDSGNTYYLLTAYKDNIDDTCDGEPDNVFIMQVANDNILEIVDDHEVRQRVYAEFMHKNSDKYDFISDDEEIDSSEDNWLLRDVRQALEKGGHLDDIVDIIPYRK
jgi:hypothetical protein